MYRHVNTNDPRTWSVTHNGRPVYDVVMADTDRGVVELYCHDKNGCRIPNAENPTGYDTLLLKGEVEIADHPLPAKQAAQQSMDEMFGYQGFGLCLTIERNLLCPDRGNLGVLWRGAEAIELFEWDGDVQKRAAEIARVIRIYQPERVRLETTGIGSYLRETLSELGITTVPFCKGEFHSQEVSRLDHLRYSRLCPVSGCGECGVCEICREYEQLTGMK